VLLTTQTINEKKSFGPQFTLTEVDKVIGDEETHNELE
jgi:hypothetical protein